MINAIKKNKWRLLSVILSMLLAAACGFFTYYGIFIDMDTLLIDTLSEELDPFERENDDVPIRIITIDEKTVAELGAYETWSRQISADLINILNSQEENPVIIGMDLLYDGEKDAVGDVALVEACRAFANVCVVVKAKEGITPDVSMPSEEEMQKNQAENGELIEEIEPEFLYPYEALSRVVQIGAVGHSEVKSTDTIREFAVSTEMDGQQIDNFSVVLYKTYQRHAGKSYEAIKANDEVVYFNYSRAFNEYITYSLVDVLNGQVDVSEFANTIVIVGDYTEQNRHTVPDVYGGQMPDAGLQANIVEALLSEKIVRVLASEVLAGVYGVLILACYTAVFLVRGKRSIPISILVLIIHSQLAFFMRNHYYVPIFPLWLFALLAIMLGLMIGYFREKENTDHLQKALETYVEADIVEEIINDSTFDIKLGGEKRDIAVLFVDIRGFTSLSEILEPEEMVAILNKYFEMVAHAVINNGGDIDKFIGDAAMAIFNTPKDLDNYVLKAVQSALDILKEASILKDYCMEKYGKEVTFGIGIQCGPAIVGNIGCECRMDYTAIGDTVNTASRLESKAKAGQILISSDVYERVKQYIVAEPIGKLTLKGKAQEIDAYQVTGLVGKEGFE